MHMLCVHHEDLALYVTRVLAGGGAVAQVVRPCVVGGDFDGPVLDVAHSLVIGGVGVRVDWTWLLQQRACTAAI